MQVDSPEKIRNLAVAGHNDTGKTTLVSALLYAGGAVNRLGRVEDGNTVTDFDPEEAGRGISIGLAPCFVPWKGHKINLLDCPGYGIFFTETRSAMAAADAVLLCVHAVSGVEVTTEKVWETAQEMGLPVVVHLTRMDRERADFAAAVAGLNASFGREVVPVELPIGSEGGFSGVVDLVHRKAWSFTRDGDGKGKAIEVPAELAEEVEAARAKLVEAVAETDDLLMERYFEAGVLSEDELAQGLARAVARRLVFPVTASSGLHLVGTSALLDALVEMAPSPVTRGAFPATDLGGQPVEVTADPAAPAAALVFKTLQDPFSGKISLFRVASGTLTGGAALWNPRLEDSEKVGALLALQGKQGTKVERMVAGDIGGLAKLKGTSTGDTLCAKERPVRLEWFEVPEPAMSFAIEPKAKGDEEKVGESLLRLMDEDIAVHTGRDQETHEWLLSTTGQRHAEITVAKLKHRYNVEVILHPPQVPYRETILRAADGHGRHKKQTGGRGQFADCRIRVEPMPRGGEFEFVDEIFGGSIPQGYRPAVEKGIQEARRRGYLAGFKVVDFRVRLKDGQYHDVDSSEMAFKIAGSLAFKDAMAQAGATILEPMMTVEISAGDESTGDVIGDLSQRRGRPQGMDSKNGHQIIKAVAPMSEMLDYAPTLRAITQGRGTFHMEFSHYEEVPRHLQEKLVAERRKQVEEE
jgi:elongation factor G